MRRTAVRIIAARVALAYRAGVPDDDASMTGTDTLRRVLSAYRTVAIVGLSADSVRPSHAVGRYLQERGYRVIPVNPRYREILGERCYPSLATIPEPVDIVDVFRKPEDCLAVAHQAVAIGARVLWLQLGIDNAQARAVAEAGGLTVIANRCIKIDYARLFGTRNWSDVNAGASA